MIIDKPETGQIPMLRKLWSEAFGDTDEFLNVFFKTAFSSERCACVTVCDDVAAALYWFDCECRGKRIAYIYAVATAKAYRGQRLCHKLMEYTHRLLKKQGYSGSVLVPVTPSLFSFYGDMGYKTSGYVSELKYTAGTEKTAVCRIQKDEYKKLRRSYLPEGGVIQEGENLDFFETQADFYKGDGFVVATRVEKGVFYGIEFLGNIGKIPYVLKTLGYSEGKFRTVGDTKAFSMYCALDTSLPPGYLGLAFD